MALNQTLEQLVASTRKFANAQGSTALLRHPVADCNDYVCRAIGSLHRKLTEAQPDQRYLASTIVTTAAGTSLYTLPADFEHLISVDFTANGVKVWMQSYENAERALLSDPSETYNGIPTFYRLRASYIEYLPTPQGVYSSTLWYKPNAQQPTTGQTFDTISRLDDYIVAYAARIIATKDKQWDLVQECRNVCAELDAEISVIGRSRDANAPGRITDVTLSNRWGRRLGASRRYSR